jgi:hypothetical protein
LCHPVDPNHDTHPVASKIQPARNRYGVIPLDPNPIILEIRTHQRPEELVC